MIGRICAASIGLILAVLSVSGKHTNDKARLVVTVRDQSGDAVPFRAYLKDASGHAVLPPNTIHYVRYNKKRDVDERHFVADGSFSCELKPGRYTLRVEKGMEWVPHEEDIELVSGRTAKRAITVRRWVDMNALGWYSGDTHIHRGLDEIEICLLAEDLNFGANVTYWNQDDEYGKHHIERPTNSIRVIDNSHSYCQAAQEIERLGKGWGAVIFMGAFEPLEPAEGPFYPLTASLCELARQRGAHIDFEKSVWRCVPVCAALGLADSVGIVHNHFHPRAFLPMAMIMDAIVPPEKHDMSPRECALYTMGLYYHLLNCGLHLGASGGSASGVMPSPVGYERTYVRLEGPYSAQAWLAGLKAGRSFATNGPVIELTVAGKSVGDRIELDAPSAKLEVACVAKSQGPIEMIEIVNNGKVVATESSDSIVSVLACHRALELSAGWVAARCFERSTRTQVYAATSPVYLDWGEPPFGGLGSAAFYRDFVQMLIDQSERENRFPEPTKHADAMTVLERARDFYARLATAKP